MAYEKTLPDGSPIMNETQFAVAYIKSLQEGGDEVKTQNVVASWHAYQRDPAGHFLSKGNQVKQVESVPLHPLPAEQGAAPVGDPLDLAGTLRMFAGDNGYSHNDYADVMRQAAEQIERSAAPVAAAEQGEPLPFAWFVQSSGFGPFIECEPFQAGAFQAYRKLNK